MLVVPYVFVFRAPGHPRSWRLRRRARRGAGFNLQAFGAALTVGIALITQMGEQADYLRFMPEDGRQPPPLVGCGAGGRAGLGAAGGGQDARRGAAGLSGHQQRGAGGAGGGPEPDVPRGLRIRLSNLRWAVAATALFVVVSQLKINVTNAYAGSLAWSNFFARLTHSHPGRVVWVVFNTLIALMLMELDVFQALGKVLGLYANVAISWMMAVVADLVINKPLGLSPPGIEFKRAHLRHQPGGGGGDGHRLGAVGVGLPGRVRADAQAFSALIALVAAFVTSPLIAWATGGVTTSPQARACAGRRSPA
jgi:hypothetical protein